MNPSHHLWLPLCGTALLSLAQLASAEEGAADASAPFLPHPEHVLFDQVEEGVLWAAGPTYKASVDARGLTFVPFHGSEAPRNEPLGLELVSVEVGAKPIVLGRAGAPRRSGEVISLERGAAVEHFRCLPGGVELSVEVEVPADARGALEVRYRRVGEQQVVERPGGGLVFLGEIGDVTLDAAFVVEPSGARVPIDVVPEPGGLRFLVPAEVVARSGGRVLIDPLIASGTITLNSFRPDRSVDIGADDSIGFYAAVERAFSATDRDVFVYQVGNFDVAGSFFAAIDVTPVDWTEPAIAARPNLDDFLVAATRGSGSGRRIWARRGDSAGSTLSSPFEVHSSSFPTHSPDICTETTGNFLVKRWCVIGVVDESQWSWGVAKTVSGIGSSVAPNNGYDYVLLGGNAKVAIAETSGTGLAPTRFRIAYTFDGGVLDEVRLRVLNRDLDSVSDVPVVSGLDVRNLDIGSSAAPTPDSPLGTSPIAYDSGFSIFREVYVVLCDGSGPRGPRVAVDELMDAGRSAARSRPSVAGHGPRWTVTFEEEPDSADPGRVYAVTGSEVAGRFGLTERRLLLSDAQDASTLPSSVSRYEGGRRGVGERSVLTGFIAASATGGAIHDSPPDVAAGSQRCEAAPNSTGRSAWLWASGGPRVGTAKGVFLQDAPADQFTLLLVASSTNYVPGIGGSAGNLCLGADRFGRYNAQLATTDPSGGWLFIVDPGSIPQANGTVAALAGEDWHFQAWFRDAPATGPTSNLSNSLHMTFTP